VTAKEPLRLQSDTAAMRYWSDGMGATTRQLNQFTSPQLEQALM
jgi:hypothetical protein